MKTSAVIAAIGGNSAAIGAPTAVRTETARGRRSREVCVCENGVCLCVHEFIVAVQTYCQL